VWVVKTRRNAKGQSKWAEVRMLQHYESVKVRYRSWWIFLLLVEAIKNEEWPESKWSGWFSRCMITASRWSSGGRLNETGVDSAGGRVRK